MVPQEKALTTTCPTRAPLCPFTPASVSRTVPRKMADGAASDVEVGDVVVLTRSGDRSGLMPISTRTVIGRYVLRLRCRWLLFHCGRSRRCTLARTHSYTRPVVQRRDR